MAQNINRVVITGNLTRDPELRHTGSGTPVCELGVAVNGRRKTAEGEWVDKPNFFNVTVWGKQGEMAAQYLSKGRPVAIDGRLEWEQWEAKDGTGKRSAVKIIADTVQFLNSGQQDGGGQQDDPQQAAEGSQAPPEGDFAQAGAYQPVPEGTDSDLPF